MSKLKVAIDDLVQLCRLGTFPKIYIGTYRHPGFSTGPRSYVGDVVGSKVLNALPDLDSFPLIWEAHSMRAPSIVGVQWSLAQLWQQSSLNFSSGLATVPWWRPISDPLMRARINQISRSPWEEFGRQLGLAIPGSAKRVEEVHKLFEDHLQHSLWPSTTEAVYDLWLRFAEAVFGKAPNFWATPYLDFIQEYAPSAFVRLPPQVFQRYISQLCQNGDKNLFLGDPDQNEALSAYLAKPEQVLKYVGWSPKGRFEVCFVDAETGKPVGKKSPIEIEQVYSLVSAGKMLPIGKAGLLLLLSDSGLLHHGAEYESKKLIAALGLVTAYSFTEPLDSWRFLLLRLPNGVVIEPNMYELFVMYGVSNPWIREQFVHCIDTCEPVTVDWEDARKHFA